MKLGKNRVKKSGKYLDRGKIKGKLERNIEKNRKNAMACQKSIYTTNYLPWFIMDLASTP